ncbi:uncharacterized protein FTJAE_14115 [Fusarium tjaetaba]|uniref:Uncharacterized protein n=1 Tax=Fusarium tjaetaba TaxID=1567544 RepID=A0A8H5QBH2_9HYPO|nr:uncharacterized protein FTJAE_14115 [Fusarium tjaetaba]KAF5612222.1 hypothetical protein FTJAE_14115 [Fusarium tjaetaba]
MSAEQSQEDTPSQREKELSAKLEKAELAIQANSQREAELLTELLRAKTALLDEAHEREHRLSAQVEQTSNLLDQSQKREQATLDHFVKLTSDYEALKERADDPSAEMLQKEAALTASRQQERQLSMELQSVKNELSSCKDSRGLAERELADAKKDLERSRNSATEQSARLDEANKKIQELSKDAEQSKQKISDMSKASEQAGRNYQSLWSRYNRLQESNKNNRYYQQSTYQWPPLPAPSQSFQFTDQPRDVNPIFDFNLGANKQGSQVNVAQGFGTQARSAATFGSASAIQPGGSRSFSHNGSSQSKSFSSFKPATLKHNGLSCPPNGPGNQKRQDDQTQQGAADPKRLKKEA